MSLRLRTLGDLCLEGTSFTRPKPLLLLAFLALEGPQDRRHLAELVYPGTRRPLGGLSSDLARLRTGAAGVVGADEGRAWSLVKCDAQELLAAFDNGEYRRGIDLYRGRFLDGVYLRGWSSEFEEWVYGTREHLADRVRDAHLRLAEVEAAQGDFEAAGKRAEEAYFLSGAGEPEPDELERIHVLLLAGGNPRAGEVKREAASFGIPLTATMEVARGRLGGPATQVGRPASHSLPAAENSFVGRESELADLMEILRQGNCRLLTLTGPGGIGKTRLALQLARDRFSRDLFPDGVIHVPLDALTTPSDIITSIAARLGIELRGNEDPVDQVARFIGDKQLLLLLDNFEHLMDGATLAAELVRACVNLRLIVTSRERLNLSEELVYPVAGLITPPGDAISTEHMRFRDATTLFEQRGKSADLRFELSPEVRPGVLRICRLVEGSPLGIELAAVWVRVIPPAEIASEIERNLDFLTTPARDVTEHHRSARAVFEHSWKLLSSGEQAVLRRLSVFRGGFRREAASEVAGATIPVLASLVDKSLVRVSTRGRYDRHPLLYQFTAQELAKHHAEKAKYQERHAQYYLDYFHPEKIQGLAQWAEEIDNLRTVFEYLIEQHRGDDATRLFVGVGAFWRIPDQIVDGMHMDEGRRLFQRIIAVPNLSRNGTLVDAFNGAGTLALDKGDVDSSRELFREAHAIARTLGDRRRLAETLSNWGALTWQLADFDNAERYLLRAVDLQRSLDDAGGLAGVLVRLGNVVRDRRHEMDLKQCGQLGRERRDFEEAIGYYHEALALARTVAAAFEITDALYNQAIAYSYNEDFETGETKFAEALSLQLESGDRRGAGITMTSLGTILLERGLHDRARDLFLEAKTISRELKEDLALANIHLNLGVLAAEAGRMAEAHENLGEALDAFRQLEDYQGVAMTLVRFAALALLEQQPEQALALIGGTEALLEQTGVSFSMNLRRLQSSLVRQAKDRLGDDVASSHREKGWGLSSEELVNLAHHQN